VTERLATLSYFFPAHNEEANLEALVTEALTGRSLQGTFRKTDCYPLASRRRAIVKLRAAWVKLHRGAIGPQSVHPSVCTLAPHIADA